MQTRRATQHHRTPALVLRRTPYGEADLILSVLTAKLGQVSVLARAARKSQRRFAGKLEPLHTLALSLDEPRGSELLRLREAQIDRARVQLLGRLDAMEMAGRFLAWIRHAAPQRTPEPELWAIAESCLDELEDRAGQPATDVRILVRLTLARHGLSLLTACGWRLELERCVVSDEPCPSGKAAMIDPARGGLVSRARGGASLSVSGAQRARLIATQRGTPDALATEDADLALSLVERSLEAHAGFRAAR